MRPAVLRTVARHLWPTARGDLERLVRRLAGDSRSRPLLNALYRRVPLARTAVLHTRFAKVFRGVGDPLDEGSWEVVFADRHVTIALRPEMAWLDWDAALSVLGHEVEIKQTYAALIRSPYRPDLFVDVGANYGLHSVLFLVHGIPTLSFEPNPRCNEYFRALCRQNRVEPRIVQAALADRAGWADLWFPETETWLGTVDAHAKERLAAGADLVSCTVRMEMLDTYLAEVSPQRVLLKVDTEGSEEAVLRGGRRTLERHRPLIVFESFPGDDRRRLYEVLERLEYGVASLPWSPSGRGHLVDQGAFLDSRASNFLALPRERVG